VSVYRTYSTSTRYANPVLYCIYCIRQKPATVFRHRYVDTYHLCDTGTLNSVYLYCLDPVHPVIAGLRTRYVLINSLSLRKRTNTKHYSTWYTYSYVPGKVQHTVSGFRMTENFCRSERKALRYSTVWLLEDTIMNDYISTFIGTTGRYRNTVNLRTQHVLQ
jgi:hypothetical protein